MWKVTTWIYLTLFLAILATALQVAGYVAPMWIWLDIDSFEVGVGLWYTRGCGLEQTCDTAAPQTAFGYTKDDLWPKPEFTAIRVLETVGVAGSVLLLLFLIIYRVGYNEWAKIYQLNLAACFTAILTWLCILAGLIVYCGFFWPIVGTSPLLSSDSFPWSIVMCLFAAFFLIVVSVLIRLKCRERSNHLKHAIPFSGDSKFDAHPLTKHGLIHRFFLPLYLGIRGNHSRDTGYLTYQTEASPVHTMNTRLVEAEQRTHLAAIDNAAFYDNRTSEESNNRYLPIERGQTVTDTAIPRSLPTAVVTYSGQYNTDYRHHHHDDHSHAPAQAVPQTLQAGRPNLDLLLRHVGDGPRDVNYRDERVTSARHGVMSRQGNEIILSADASYQDRGVIQDVTYQTREDAAEDVTYARVQHHPDGMRQGIPPQNEAYDQTGVAGSRDVRYHSETVTRHTTVQEGDETTRNAGYQEGHHANRQGQGNLHDAAYMSGDMVRRDAAFYDVQENEEARRRVLHTGYSATFHGEGRGQDAAYRSSEEADTRVAAYRSGEEDETRIPAYRNGEEVDTRIAAYRSGEEVDTRIAAYRRGEDDTRIAAYRSGEEVDTRIAAYRRGEDDSRIAAYRSGEEVDTRIAAYRRGEEGDSRVAAYRSGDMVRRDASGNTTTEEHVITTTTTTSYITERGRQKRGEGLKVTDVELSDGDARAHYYSATAATVDGHPVTTYDDTFIFRPYSETI